VKLASAPRSIRDGFDVLPNAGIEEFPIEPVNVRHDKSIGRAVAGPFPRPGVVPLKMELHTVSPDGRIVGIPRGPAERPGES